MKINWNYIIFGAMFFIIGWLAVPSPFFKKPQIVQQVVHDTIHVSIPPVKDSTQIKIPIIKNKAQAVVRKDSAIIAVSATISGDTLDLSFAWNIQPAPIEFVRDTIVTFPSIVPTECPSPPFFLKPEFAYPTGVAIGAIICYIVYVNSKK